jgi:hypothetical protein
MASKDNDVVSAGADAAPADAALSPADAAVAAVAAPSYALEHTSFPQAMGSLLAAAVGPLACDAPWAVSAKKLKTAYDRVSDSAQFQKMFAAFFAAHADALKARVVRDNGCIGDAFFREGAAPPVVYYSAEPRLAAVCLPIGEIYKAALAKHREAPASKLLPTRVLLDFYAAVYHSVPETATEALEALEQNVVDLCAAAESVAPGTGPGAAAAPAAAAAPLSGLLGGANPMDLISTLLGALGGANGAEMGDALKGITSVVSKVVERVQAPGADGAGAPTDAAQVVQRLSTLLGSADIQQEIAASATSATAALGKMTGGAAAPAAAAPAPAISELPTE